MNNKEFSRRGFLRSAFALTATAPVVGFPAIVHRRDINSMLSHACVGVGGMGGCDLDGLSSHRDLHITALCDVDETILKKAAAKFPGARLYRNANEMLAAEGNKIDSINVSTPDHSHAGYVIDALQRGLNVYGQKPLCTKISDCRKIEQLVADKQAVTQLGTQIAAWECDRQTAAFIKNGSIGEVRHVWIFSNRGGHSNAKHTWPLTPSPVPATLDWKTWLAGQAYRPYVKDVYHPGRWRHFRDFGTSWLGDLGLHLLSPIWIGGEFGKLSPTSVMAKTTIEDPEIMKVYWPRNSHVTWEMPGVKSSGGKPFTIEWCDGCEKLADSGYSTSNSKPQQDGVVASRDKEYFVPPFIKELYAKTPIGEKPLEGRVVEGSDGWLLSVHLNISPSVIKKDGKILKPPYAGPAKSHWHEYVDCCLQGGETTSAFSWAGRLSEMVLLGNQAMNTPGKKLMV